MMKFLKGFSLIELLISLIVISCITAAFTPVITKKLKTSAVALNSSSSEITTECKEKFSESCKLCTKSYCIQCELSSCAVGKYAENKTCSCKDCSSLFSDCVECNSAKCTKCKQTHYIKEGKCEICPAGKICDGVDAHDASYCTNPPAGYFCDANNTPRKCTDKYSNYCSLCNSSQCTKCDDRYFISGGTCKPCIKFCAECDNATTCKRCNSDRILNNEKTSCQDSCWNAIDNCLYCTNSSTCTKCYAGYYVNSDNKCSSCSNLENCFICSDSSTCTKCVEGYYVNSSNKCALCTIANCAQCDKDGRCLSCKQGYHLSSDKRSCKDNENKFNCSDSNFMQIGNLCVTRKNMGDSYSLAIPTSVTVVSARNEYCYSVSNKCCWKGETAGTSGKCDSANGGYSGCNRTICNYNAAKEICSKFNYGGKTWRLATRDEMRNWGNSSIGLKENGLMLCDTVQDFSSACCTIGSNDCSGSADNTCRPAVVWGADKNTSSTVNGIFGFSTAAENYAYSVRCVTEM